MSTIKRVLSPERLRQVPEQFSWVDQGLVQQHYIDRFDARAAALYLFLVTVGDAQGLSYYGGSTLMQRLHLSVEELGAARQQLIELGLIAYQAPLYQVLALPGTPIAPRKAPRAQASTPPPAASITAGGPVSIGQLLEQLEKRRGRL